MTTKTAIIELENLKIRLGGQQIHEGLNLSVKHGEVLGIVGTSGAGKTTLLHEILMLQRPESGSVWVLGKDLTKASKATRIEIQKHWGVLFQQNALFSSLTVLENVSFPLQEHSQLDAKTIREVALLKLLLVGLSTDTANKYPAELSGGMQKRAALARAIALDPKILFLDEPTTGLDPESASALDELILNLQSTMRLTIVLVTHDLNTLWRIANRVAYLDKGKMLAIDTMDELVKNPNSLIQEFFNGPRGRAAKDSYQKTYGNQR